MEGCVQSSRLATQPGLPAPMSFEVVASNISSCLQDMERFGYSQRIEKDAQVPTMPGASYGNILGLSGVPGVECDSHEVSSNSRYYSFRDNGTRLVPLHHIMRNLLSTGATHLKTSTIFAICQGFYSSVRKRTSRRG